MKWQKIKAYIDNDSSIEILGLLRDAGFEVEELEVVGNLTYCVLWRKNETSFEQSEG